MSARKLYVDFWESVKNGDYYFRVRSRNWKSHLVAGEGHGTRFGIKRAIRTFLNDMNPCIEVVVRHIQDPNVTGDLTVIEVISM